MTTSAITTSQTTTGETLPAETLLLRAEELKTRIGELVAANQGANTRGAMASRRDQIQADEAALRKAIQPLLALRSLGVYPEMDAAFLANTIAGWSILKDNLQADADYLRPGDGEDVYRKQRRFLTDLTGKIRAACQSAWQTAFPGFVPPVDAHLLAALIHVPETKDAATRLQNQLRQLETFHLTAPGTDAEAKRFRATCDTAASLWAAVSGADIPTSVLDFFGELAARQNRLPLALLTQEVRQWLDDKGLSDRFYVCSE